MIAAYDGKIYDNSSPWVDYVVSDILDGQTYSIYLDVDGNVYCELSSDTLGTFDIIDELTGVYYGLFVYNGQVHSAPVKSPSGETIYGNSCFISAGATINLQIMRATDTPTVASDITVNIFDQSLQQFLTLEVTVTELLPNIFMASFIIPIKGDFLSIVNVLGTTYLAKKFEVQNYSYQELVIELEKVIGTLNIGNAYI